MTAKPARRPLTDRSDIALATERPAVNPTRLRYDYGQIANEHREQVQFATIAIQDYMGRASESIIEAGKELIAIREILPHGQFTDWVETEFGLSERMAQHMMNAAREYGSNPKRVSGFADSVIYMLSAPSTPESAREEIEAEAKATGKAPTRKKATATIRKHKPEPEYTHKSPPEGYHLHRVPSGGWQWRRELGEHTTIGGTKFNHAGDAIAEAHEDYAQRMALKAAKEQPEPQPPQSTADIAAAGYAIEYHDRAKKYRWLCPGRGTGVNYGLLHNTLEEAIEDARETIRRGVRFLTDAPEPLAPEVKTRAEEPSIDRNADRRARLQYLINEYRQTIATFAEYGDTTGAHTDTLMPRRGLERMITRLENNLEALSK